MHLFDHEHHLYFSHKTELTALSFSLAILRFGEGLVSIFVPIYFFSQLNLPIWQIITYFLALSTYFVLIAAIILPLIRKMSDKMLMLLGVVFLILYFYSLQFITADATSLLYTIPALYALGTVLFNVGYNISFSSASDDKHMGREISQRYIYVGVFTLMAPFLGGVVISFFGFGNVFIAGAIVMLLSTLPLLFFNKRNISSKLNFKSIFDIYRNKKLKPFQLSSIGYAMEVMTARIIWPIFMFIAIGSVEAFGGIISLSLLAGLATTYVVGRLSDHGARRRILKWSTVLYSPLWATRALLSTANFIIGSHALGTILKSALMVSWNSQYYKIAHILPQSSVFILSQELVYNLTRIVYLSVLAVLSYYLSLQSFLIVTFILTGLVVLLFLNANKLRQSELGAVQE